MTKNLSRSMWVVLIFTLTIIVAVPKHELVPNRTAQPVVEVDSEECINAKKVYNERLMEIQTTQRRENRLVMERNRLGKNDDELFTIDNGPVSLLKDEVTKHCTSLTK